MHTKMLPYGRSMALRRPETPGVGLSGIRREMLYVESENPVTGRDTVIFSRYRDVRPGQTFGSRRTSKTRKYPEFQELRRLRNPLDN